MLCFGYVSYYDVLRTKECPHEEVKCPRDLRLSYCSYADFLAHPRVALVFRQRVHGVNGAEGESIQQSQTNCYKATNYELHFQHIALSPCVQISELMLSRAKVQAFLLARRGTEVTLATGPKVVSSNSSP